MFAHIFTPYTCLDYQSFLFVKVEVPKSLKLILQNIAKSVDKVGVVIPRRQSFLNKKGGSSAGNEV